MTEGCVWIAHGGSQISRATPDARLMRSIALPTSNITRCVLAGGDLDRMIVTSSIIDCGEKKFAALCSK